MGKPELGTKRTCPSCGTKYYDLNRTPIVCPSCGTVFAVAAPQRAERPVEPKPEKKEETVEVERDAGVVSLEEAEEGTEEADVGPDADSDEEEPSIPDVEVDAEIEDDADEDTFLEEDEEGGDDVSGLLDVDAEDEDER